MRVEKYKSVNIIRAKSGDWRICYEFEIPNQPGKYKKFYVRDGINYVHDLELKEKAAQQLKKDIEFALKNGFNPFLPDLKIDSSISAKETQIKISEEITYPTLWTVEVATEKFLEYCIKTGLEHNTIRTYTSFINNFRKFVEKMDKPNTPISLLTDQNIQDFLDYYFYEEEWSARTYNNHAKFMSQLFSRIEKLEKKINSSVKYIIDLSDLIMKKDKAEKNKYYTPLLANKVKKEIAKDSEMYKYTKWIFYSCMRPKEIKLLQIKDIDTEARQIKVNGKTGYRFVPICDELMKLISEMNLLNLPLNYYVFGVEQQPNKKHLYDDYFSRRYQKLKDKLKLDYNYTLYSWKHTRVVSLITAGFDDNQVMTLTGHRDRAGFEAYKRDLVIDNSSMKGKTIDF